MSDWKIYSKHRLWRTINNIANVVDLSSESLQSNLTYSESLWSLSLPCGRLNIKNIASKSVRLSISMLLVTCPSCQGLPPVMTAGSMHMTMRRSSSPHKRRSLHFHNGRRPDRASPIILFHILGIAHWESVLFHSQSQALNCESTLKLLREAIQPKQEDQWSMNDLILYSNNAPLLGLPPPHLPK